MTTPLTCFSWQNVGWMIGGQTPLFGREKLNPFNDLGEPE